MGCGLTCKVHVKIHLKNTAPARNVPEVDCDPPKKQGDHEKALGVDTVLRLLFGSSKIGNYYKLWNHVVAMVWGDGVGCGLTGTLHVKISVDIVTPARDAPEVDSDRNHHAILKRPCNLTPFCGSSLGETKFLQLQTLEPCCGCGCGCAVGAVGWDVV